jgi:tripartite-type tricarboxylate transporter receptor subunit TctC
MMHRLSRLAHTLVLTAAVFVPASVAAADPVADFYRGKQLRLIIGYGEGGGYDLYGRLAAEFLRKHIPGNPTIIPQNMPGAGSMIAVRYIYSVAPKDGTVFGSVDQSLALNSATYAEQINTGAFNYIGRLTSNIDTGVGLPGAGFSNFDDARKREIVVGVSLQASTAVLLPSSLRQYGGAKFKLVRGYKGAAEMMVALQRNEVQLVGGVGVPLLVVRNPEWIFGPKKATFLYQNALERHPLLKHVPTLPELALNDEGRTVLRAIASTAEIGRSILTTPGVPPERLAALRKAFMNMVADPEFVQTVKKRNIELTPAPGERIDQLVRETSKLPKDLLDKINSLTKSR